MQYTQDNITELASNQIFVFGSNLAGHHGKGAALQARQFGAIEGTYNGIQGQAYAIPTKTALLTNQPLPLHVIQQYVDEFVGYATRHTSLVFLVTKIGCGYTGYNVRDIAPLFVGALKLSNAVLPMSFVSVINKNTTMITPNL